MAAEHDAEPIKRVEIPDIGPVVSSAHLANSSLPALSEVEFALTMANNAYHRWMMRCMTAAGLPGLFAAGNIDRASGQPPRPARKTLADICLVLNVEDTHLANYAIKKTGRARAGSGWGARARKRPLP